MFKSAKFNVNKSPRSSDASSPSLTSSTEPAIAVSDTLRIVRGRRRASWIRSGRWISQPARMYTCYSGFPRWEGLDRFGRFIMNFIWRRFSQHCLVETRPDPEVEGRHISLESRAKVVPPNMQIKHLNIMDKITRDIWKKLSRSLII